MSPENQAIPWWAKLILYGGIATGALVILYYTVRNIFLGGVDAYKDMWKQQYQALMKKMADYQKSNPSGFTTSQQQNIAEEEKVLQLTTQGLANAMQGLYNTLTWMFGTIIVVAGVVGIVSVSKWLDRTKGQWNTAHGAGYIVIMSLADDLATNGFPIQATNLVASAQSMFQTFDLPFMQQTITTLQSQIPILTGIQLLVAQQIVSTLTMEISFIPVWLTTPLPII